MPAPSLSSRRVYPSFSLVLATAKGVVRLKDSGSAISREVHLHIPMTLLPHAQPACLTTAAPSASSSTSASQSSPPPQPSSPSTPPSSLAQNRLLTTIDTHYEDQVTYVAAYDAATGGTGSSQTRGSQDIEQGRSASVHRTGYLRRFAAVFAALYRKLRGIGVTVASGTA